MFVAWRELRFARGRFVLIGAVVAMIMVLVGFLSGLTGGLAGQNVSAVLDLGADQVAFNAPEGSSEATFTESTVTKKQRDQWTDAEGVDSVHPVGIRQMRVSASGATTTAAVFGVERGMNVPMPTKPGTVVASESVAESLGVAAGDTIEVAGQELQVASLTRDSWFSHTPVIWANLDDWRTLTDSDTWANVLVINGSADGDQVDATAGTTSSGHLSSLTAVGSFRSEIGSLGLMVGMLFAISALVVGAFFTVWTMQRREDIAVLKALGASTRSLMADAIGQALVVLTVGIGVGLALVLGLGMLAGQALPFLIHPATTLLPALVMTVLGLGGAAFALRTVTSADPLGALGGNR